MRQGSYEAAVTVPGRGSPGVRRSVLDTPGKRQNTQRFTRNAEPAALDMDWLEQVNWAKDGLVAAIAQDAVSGTVLTLAWMNREALARTAETGEAHYWSRSRRRLWRKGEASGHVQRVREIRLDCDSDAILLRFQWQLAL